MRETSGSVRVLCLQVSSSAAAILFWRGLALGACTVLAACGSGGLGPWQEEVRLSDGRVIVVERYEEAEVRTPMGDVGGAFLTRTTLKVVAPPALATLPVLTIDRRPLVLDFDPTLGTWFVIAFDERACMKPIPEAIHAAIMDESGRINLRPNAEYRLINGKWVGVPLSADRIGLPVNLLVQRTTVDSWKAMRKPMPLSEKQRLDSHVRIPEKYRHIVAHVSCG